MGTTLRRSPSRSGPPRARPGSQGAASEHDRYPARAAERRTRGLRTLDIDSDPSCSRGGRGSGAVNRSPRRGYQRGVSGFAGTTS